LKRLLQGDILYQNNKNAKGGDYPRFLLFGSRSEEALGALLLL
jgi:hypothetical protein